ncbi:MAG TPA: hypothetical protein DCE41_19550 [Cytophagales bacterium]|nr:hypothetical protein [Cytophagales bacterium]HAP64006.1 hypothetical protein [Cytophagales bacterium]
MSYSRSEPSVACTADSGCWCMALPQVMELEEAATCLSKEDLAQKIKDYFEVNPEAARKYWRKPEGRIPVLDCTEGVDYHVDERGRWVFTAYYHLRKGYCCQNGCKHCPYGYSKTKTP